MCQSWRACSRYPTWQRVWSLILKCFISSPEHEVLMVSYCGQWLSVVVHCVSTFNVYSLETTFVIQFLWNLVRMFVLTISRPSSNMGHVESKTRSPGQILENSCLHFIEATFVIRFWWNFVRMFVLAISRPSLNMGQVGLTSRSPGQILQNSCLHSRGHICDPILMKLGQNVCLGNI